MPSSKKHASKKGASKKRTSRTRTKTSATGAQRPVNYAHHDADLKGQCIAAMLTGQGLSETARAYNVPVSTLKGWRDSLPPDKIASISAAQRGRFDILLRDFNVLPRFARPVRERDAYTERDFVMAVADEIYSVAARLNLPPVEGFRCEVQMPTGVRFDILLQHPNGKYSIIEVKTASGNAIKSLRRILYTTIGQLLYYHEVFVALFDVEPDDVSLCVVTDYEFDAHFYNSLKHVTKPIGVLNVKKVWNLEGDL